MNPLQVYINGQPVEAEFGYDTELMPRAPFHRLPVIAQRFAARLGWHVYDTVKIPYVKLDKPGNFGDSVVVMYETNFGED